MRRKLSFLLCALSALWCVTAFSQNLLPYPQKVKWGKGTVKTDRLSSNTVPGKPAGWYALQIDRRGVSILYSDDASRHYATATLDQLAVGPCEYRCCTIEDWPRYAWRGAMIDVSRHFFTIEHLKKQVDILASYKINRLHLHLTDAAGWRMEIKRYPRLTEQSAYRTESDWNKWWIGKDRRYVASPSLPPSLSPSKFPSVIGFSRSPKRELCHPSPSLLVILNNVVEATNVGAIFRSAAALGVDGVILVRSCDPLNRRALRVSMGNVFLVPWTVWEGDDLSLYAALRRKGYRTAALALTDDSVTLDDPALRAEPRLALIMGTEGDGLPRESIADADYVVRIPMANGVDSLNVAAASAVAFYALKER